MEWWNIDKWLYQQALFFLIFTGTRVGKIPGEYSVLYEMHHPLVHGLLSIKCTISKLMVALIVCPVKANGIIIYSRSYITYSYKVTPNLARAHVIETAVKSYVHIVPLVLTQQFEKHKYITYTATGQ